ncbi:MAG: phage terminase large subunit [Candidatus Heimdallarchaeota archaeon]|nr:phage terminase large subunit [Candidatus Heimdallarchaeota archaeon]
MIKQDGNRIIINMPPRMLKSTLFSISLPALILGINPSANIIVASYSQALSNKHSLDTRLILQSEWYKELFPDTKLSKTQNTKTKFVTTKQGFRLATSIGGTLTGEGGDYLILDDPINPLQVNSAKFRERCISWFEQTFLPRLNDRKNASILIAMHRLHQEDITGYIKNKHKKNWHILSLPIVMEKKISIKSRLEKKKTLIKLNKGFSIFSNSKITKIKEEVGCYVFASQYQQNPISLLNAIKPFWIKRYNKVDYKDSDYRIIQSWDTAISVSSNADYSVCITFLEFNSNIYILNILRARLNYIKLKEFTILQAEKWNPTIIIIENKASGQQIIQELKNLLPIIQYTPNANKNTRLLNSLPTIESGQIYLPHYSEWLMDFEMELFNFPAVKHDDQVDSFTQYIEWRNKENINNLAGKVKMRRL